MLNILFKLILVIRSIENFPQAIFDKLGLLEGQLLYRLSSGVKFYARAGTEDLAEIAVVGSGREYRLDRIKLKRNPTVVDLGGYIGTFSIPLALKLKNKCKIFVYEPDNTNFEFLNKNIELNGVSSIEVKRMAISDKQGKGYLITKNVQTDGYHLSDTKKSSNCQLTTFPKIIKDNKIEFIDILKMDIEGGEYKLFKSNKSLKSILESVHYLFMEYHNIDSKRNYSSIQKIIEDNFNILDHHGVTMALENKRYAK